MEPAPAEPRQDPFAADASTLEQMGVLPAQPVADPQPPPPPVYDAANVPA